jgi:hypothetical protein
MCVKELAHLQMEVARKVVFGIHGRGVKQWESVSHWEWGVGNGF